MPALSRRRFLGASLALPYAFKAFAAVPQAGGMVYFGCDTSSGAKGIYSATWDAAKRTLSQPALAIATARPSFLAMHGDHVYAVNAVASDAASVTALARHADGALSEINAVPAGGFGPAYISIHSTGKAAYVANYFSGSISSYDIHPDGSLAGPVSHFQYSGHGANPKRQEAPHAHSALLSPDERFLLINDLGLDQIHIYRVDAARPALLTPNSPAAWRARAGSGPRHLAFLPGGRYAFNVNEIDSTLDVLAWNAKDGVLTTVGQPVSTVAADFKGTNTAAEVMVSPDGRFLYTSNRGENSIAVFGLSAAKGAAPQLTLVQRISCGGKTPRQITLSPDGNSLLAANQDSSNVAVFTRDRRSGQLKDTDNSVALPAPMFILFA
jgi:6-phosphogluconolactonase